MSSEEQKQPAPAGIQHLLAIPLPKSLNAHIHIHLTIHTHHILLFLTSRTLESSGPAPLGSFVYALPSATHPSPLSTPLYVREDTIEMATRVAKILAKRTGRPVYVGCSLDFSPAGRGGSVEEEMEAVRKVIEIVVKKVDEGAVVEGMGKVQIR